MIMLDVRPIESWQEDLHRSFQEPLQELMVPLVTEDVGKTVKLRDGSLANIIKYNPKSQFHKITLKIVGKREELHTNEYGFCSKRRGKSYTMQDVVDAYNPTHQVKASI